MKAKQRSMVTVALLCIALFQVGAAVAWEPFLGFGKGKAEINDENHRFYELSVGTPLGSRVSVEAFLLAQPLAKELTSEDNAFALMSGMRASLTLFQDATFNPMVQASIGQMILGNIKETESYPDLAWHFYSSIATGFELNLFDSFQILVLGGYRFAPHEAQLGMQANTLSSPFNSVSFRANLR
ncbi:MAG: hypothetical protein GX626_11360 [Spirochaetales bacterium]|nr:hypothetical protein [Spirochaetales bacterium]